MTDALYEILADLGYSHPIHAVFVHLPVGLTLGAFILYLTGALLNRRDYQASAHHVSVLALLFLGVAIPTGIMDWQRFFGGAWLFEIKMKIGLAGVLVVLLSLMAVFGRRPEAHRAFLPALYFLGVLNVGGLGFFGGQLVFRGRVPEAPAYLHVGQRIFDSRCSGCHQRGGNIFEPNLPLRSAPQLDEYEEFRKFLRAPRLPNGMPGPMPAFGENRLTDADVKNLYDYIRFAFVKPARDGE